MADVFIAYKREERSRAELIATALRARGYSLWYDAALIAGEMFSDEINREVRAAKCVLTLWSPRGKESAWLRAETQIGLQRRVLVSAFVERTTLPPQFAAIDTVDLSDWRGDSADRRFQVVLDRIARLVGRGPETTAPDIAEWAVAQGLNTREGYEDYARRFPSSRFATEARRRGATQSATAQKGRVFLSYRRDDTQAVARLICERLAAKIGRDNIFFDVDGIPLGVAFDKHIEAQLIQCSTLLAIIGGSWLGRRPFQKSRIHSPRDFVRREIELAFKQRLRVIPILITPHPIPRVSDLPKSLHSLPSIQFAELSLGRDYEPHVKRILDAIQ